METLTQRIIPNLPEKITPTPQSNTVPVRFNVADFQYKQFNGGFIAQVAKRLVAGQRLAIECYSLSFGKSNEYYLTGTLHIGITGAGKQKAVRINMTKDLEGFNSESLIPTHYPEQVNDPVAIATELTYYCCKMNYDYVRERVAPIKGKL